MPEKIPAERPEEERRPAFGSESSAPAHHEADASGSESRSVSEAESAPEAARDFASGSESRPVSESERRPAPAPAACAPPAAPKGVALASDLTDDSGAPAEKPKSPPSADPSTSGQNPRFALIAASRRLPRKTAVDRLAAALGAPAFDPPIPATALFNIWAYLLGPLYYFLRGLWRKGLILTALFAGLSFFHSFLNMPLFSDGQAVLLDILMEGHFLPSFGLYVLAFLLTVGLCTGHRRFALGMAALFLLMTLLGQYRDPGLDLGGFSSFLWLAAFSLWDALATAAIFFLLAGERLTALTCLALMLVPLLAGLPASSLLQTLLNVPDLLIGVVCGLSASWDLYRRRVLGQKVWW